MLTDGIQMKGFLFTEGVTILKRGGNVNRIKAEGNGIMRGMKEKSRG